MRVLMLSKACCVAAYRRKLEELAAMPDVELTLIVPPRWRGQVLEEGFSRGYKIIVEPPRFNGRHHWHFYPGLRQHLERLCPQILHIDEEPYDFVTFHALRAGRAVRAKTLFFTWQNIYRPLPPPFSLFLAYTLTRADAAIAGNSEASQILRRRGFRGPLYIIPQFGVDPDVYRPEMTVAEVGNSFLIGYVGRLVEEKGVLFLIEALAGLKGNWRLWLIGGGPLQERIPKLAQQLGIGDRVKLKGSVPSRDMPRHLNQLHVLVLPSLTRFHWKEQFGRALVEAMACQVPVIGSDSGEIPNVIGDAGLLFPEGDAEALRTHLRTLMADPELRDRLARQGRKRVEAHFTQKRVAEETYKAYRSLLELTKSTSHPTNP